MASNLDNKQPRAPSPQFVSMKLRIQRAALGDPRLAATQLRMLLYVLHSSWPHPENGQPWARIADDAIMDDVPGFAASTTCYRTRKHLAELGYWTYAAGRGITATAYHFASDPAPHVIAKLDTAILARKADVEARKAARVTHAETLQSQHKSKRESGRRSAAGDPANRLSETARIAGMSYPLPYPEESLPVTEDSQSTRTSAKTCSRCAGLATMRNSENGRLLCEACAEDDFQAEPI